MKYYYILFILLLANLKGYAQDVITTTTGKTLKVKMTEITTNKIYYKLYNVTDAPELIMNRDEVASIKYENGSKFDPHSFKTVDDNELAEQGFNDALEYYHKTGGAWAGTFTTTLLAGGLAGLIPAIACSDTPPKDKRLGYPDSALMRKEPYRVAYTETAQKMKSRSVWSAYGLGMVPTVIAALIIILTNTTGH